MGNSTHSKQRSYVTHICWTNQRIKKTKLLPQRLALHCLGTHKEKSSTFRNPLLSLAPFDICTFAFPSNKTSCYFTIYVQFIFFFFFRQRQLITRNFPIDSIFCQISSYLILSPILRPDLRFLCLVLVHTLPQRCQINKT